MTRIAVDRPLPDRRTVLEAVGSAPAPVGEASLLRLRPLYYPVYRLETAYRDDGEDRTTTLVVDGTYAGGEDHLANYAESVAATTSVAPDDRHDADATMYLPSEGDPDGTATLFEEWMEDARDRLDREGPGGERERERLRDVYDLPAAFGPRTYRGVEDVTQLFLPFWIAEFGHEGGDTGRFLTLRDAGEVADGSAPDRHAWLSERIAESDPFTEAYRDGPGLVGDAAPDDGAADDEPVTPDGVDLSADRLLEPPPDRTFDDVGGMDSLLDTLRRKVIDPLRRPERFDRYGLGTVNGVLLHGPPGCGKTHVAGALAGELDRSYVPLSPTELTSKWVGEAADNVADVFAVARANQPSLVFVDEIDAVAADRSGDMTNTERQMVNQLLTELESLDGEDVVTVAATNLLEEIDDAVLRSGRFDERIEVPPPDAPAREAVLDVHLADRPTADDLPLGEVAARTAGYAASDLALIAEEAARRALADDAPVGPDHLLAAVDDVESSIPGWVDAYDDLGGETTASFGDAGERRVREPPAVELDAGELVDPDPTPSLSEVAGAAEQRRRLRARVVDPALNPDPYEEYGLGRPSGALLYGPPGCGKTFLSRAVAGELDVPFVRIRPADLLGVSAESPEEAAADVAAIARANQPCVLFLDDLDALSGHGSVAGRAHRRLLEAVATELRGLTDEAVVVLGATHLVEDVHEDLRRSDTFDERIEVPPPDADTRRAVLADAIPDDLLAPGFDWERVLAATAGYSCGDLLLVAETGSRRALRDDERLRADHLLAAVRNHRSAVADWPDRTQYSDSEYGSDLRYIS